MFDVSAPADRTIRLNRSERVYLALEGVAGAIAQTHVLRFAEPHSEATLRAAVRLLVSLFPRLRALVQATAFGHRLRVLPEGAAIDGLFANVFRAGPELGRDTESLDACLVELANLPFALESALPLRVRLLYDGPLPVLILNLHHIVSDGRGAITLIDTLLAILNGVAPKTAAAIDPPSMIPALLPPAFPILGRVRSLWRSFWVQRRERRSAPHCATLGIGTARGSFGPTGVRLHRAAIGLDALKRCAESRDCTVTELLVALFVQSFAHAQEAVAPNQDLAATVRLSLDLRPYFTPDRRPRFGNYVASFLIHVRGWNDLGDSVAEVHAQVRRALCHFQNHEMSYGLLLAEVAPRLLGRKALGWAARALKRRGKFQPITFHFSNLGGGEALNRHGQRAHLAALTFFTPALGPYIGCVGISGRLCCGISFPADEVPEAAIDRVLIDFDRRLSNL